MGEAVPGGVDDIRWARLDRIQVGAAQHPLGAGSRDEGALSARVDQHDAVPVVDGLERRVRHRDALAPQRLRDDLAERPAAGAAGEDHFGAVAGGRRHHVEAATGRHPR
jgi:hypothetical protein